MRSTTSSGRWWRPQASRWRASASSLWTLCRVAPGKTSGPLGHTSSHLLMLSVRNLTKVYEGGVVALRDVSFDIPDGQFLAVIGLSGSGKSTLLRCINRLIEPTSGQILWDDLVVTAAGKDEVRRIRRRIGMVF